LPALAVLPENKQGKDGDKDPVFKIGIGVVTDPLQNQVGEDGSVQPGDQQ
jgi:hypothetical protein